MHRMKEWMEAYGDGLDAKNALAQIQVKKFGSKHYVSQKCCMLQLVSDA